MKKLIALLAVAVLCFNVALAQSKVQEIADKLTDKMCTTLKLNDDQKKKVSDLNKKYVPKLENVLTKADLTTDQKKEELKKIDNDQDQSLKKILSDDQYAKWQKEEDAVRGKVEENAQKVTDLENKAKDKANDALNQGQEKLHHLFD